MAKKTAGQLTSIEHGAFDTAALQQELAQALEDDRLYKLTDNAKKRAIHTAANYDEFKNLVACADLKPIKQKELRDFSKAERQTNISFKPKKSWKKPEKERCFEPAASSTNAPPKSAADMDADLMAEIIHVLVLSWRHEPAASDPQEPEQATFALQMMQALTQTSRFSLILDFLDNHQLDKVHDLFQLMEGDGRLPAKQQQEILISLKTKFRIDQ
ncbi:hypothetical protein BBJ28_00001787 [Nothophytophthora sp. Chile5]|nr:hypothetical protein BBJ28_00001787 [Nothophytophthora sp. Chile5]